MFDTRRLRPSGLACELVAARDAPGSRPTACEPVRPHPLRRQLRPRQTRSPSSRCTSSTGSRRPTESRELAAIAQWLAGWATRGRRLGHQPHRSRRLQHRPPRRPALPGLHLDRAPPTRRPELRTPHRSSTTRPAATRHFYDQIAWFTGGTRHPAARLHRSPAPSTSPRLSPRRHHHSCPGGSPTTTRCGSSSR